MKKEYIAPEFEVVQFESEDIITDSAKGINEKALTQESLLIYNF